MVRWRVPHVKNEIYKKEHIKMKEPKNTTEIKNKNGLKNREDIAKEKISELKDQQTISRLTYKEKNRKYRKDVRDILGMMKRLTYVFWRRENREVGQKPCLKRIG